MPRSLGAPLSIVASVRRETELGEGLHRVSLRGAPGIVDWSSQGRYVHQAASESTFGLSLIPSASVTPGFVEMTV
jgi:hypothetical protein